jgi:uncharacterized protein
VRDYEDALTALRRGHGVGGRERLLWLATTLWARSELEVARIELLFRCLPPPSRAEVQELARPDAPEEPETPASPELPKPADAHSASAAAAPRVEFAAPDGPLGGLPSVRHGRVPLRHYVFEPRPLLPQRALIVAWRRLRRAARAGPKTELDLDATISARCRDGWVVEPVRVAARRNQARLIVLADASASMLPWRAMNRLIEASLPAGMLAHARVLYFDNDPRAGLYRTEGLTGRVDLGEVLRQEADSAALLIGDAGAARGRFDRDRVAGTRAFLRQVRGPWSALAWLNPMPRHRWAGTSAQRVAIDLGLAMFEFSDEGITRAIDVLRGADAG